MSGCAAMDRWLAAGGAAFGPVPGEALAHAALCARCGARLAAERELEALLSALPAAPAGFTAGVMRRVAAARPSAAPQPRVALPAPAPAALPLWVRVAAEPAVVLASLVAAAVAWKASALLALAHSLTAALAGPFAAAAPAGTHALSVFLRPEVGLGLLTALVVPLTWVSWLLYDGLRRLPAPPPSGAR